MQIEELKLIAKLASCRLPHLEEEIFKDIELAEIYIDSFVDTEMIRPSRNLYATIYHYAVIVLQGRWWAAESTIITNAKWAFYYARDVIGGRWPQAEFIIKADAEWSYYYAIAIIKGPWPEAESTILANQGWAYCYVTNIGKICPEAKSRVFYL